MIKKIFITIVASALCVSTNIHALNYYEMMLARVNNLGVKISAGIEGVDNLPLVDKLTNLLPFAMVAACFKECPGQTMVVLTGWLIYVLFQSDKFRSVLRKYNLFNKVTNRSIKNQPEFDDSLFIFEGDDAEDAEEQEDNEEELLSDEEELPDQDICRRKAIEETPLNFL